MGPPAGELSPGTFSLAPWRPAPASARPWRLPQAALASLLLPSRPPASQRSLPCTCTPPLGHSPLALLPFPGGGPTTDQYNPFSLPPFFLPLTLGSRNESSASVVIVRWNRLSHRQGLAESGFRRTLARVLVLHEPPKRLRRSPTPLLGRHCTSSLIARSALTNRLAPSQPSPAGTGFCRALRAN